MPRYRDVYELAEEVGGMFVVVVAAAKRAKQIRDGRQPVVEIDSANPLTIAIEELLEGRVVVRPADEEPEEPAAEMEVVEVPGGDSPPEPEAEAADEGEAPEEAPEEADNEADEDEDEEDDDGKDDKEGDKEADDDSDDDEAEEDDKEGDKGDEG